MKLLITIILVLFSQLTIYSQVIANQPNDIIFCDDNNDGFASFDLQINSPAILGSQDPSEFSVTYHETLSDAVNNNASIIMPYVNAVPSSQVIFARVTESSTSDFATTEFSIGVIDCQDDGFDDDGVSDSDEDLNNNGNLDDDDTDSDGIPNYLDDDDDNDGILTINEDYNLNGDPTDDDTDSSGVADYLESNVALNVNTFSENLFKIYPNPTNNILFIEGNQKSINIHIYNLIGKKVLSKINSNEIDVKLLPSGIYIIKISDGLSQTIRKFIKK